MASGTRLLVCSIGNPAPYLNTLHSAGHTVLNVLRESLSYPSFQKSRAHGNGLLSTGSHFTLWQSPSLMNVSGPAVSAAWKQFVRENKQIGYGEEECGLVVVHDELELRVGEVKVRKGDASPKGHNGLKSIRDTLRGQMYTRIGVGIGRPESRDAGVVADYVLRKMSVEERRKISVSAGKVMEELMKLSEQ
jgi:PTH1 family peptidyl-tRNA hydrolase